MKCPKCRAVSGDDWSQCNQACPMPQSPYFRDGQADLYKTVAFTPKPRKKKAVREKQVEADSKARVAAAGGLSLKFTSPGRRSVPDQIELYGTKAMVDMLTTWFPSEPLDAMERFAHALLAAGIQFTECKRPGEVPTSEQLREHARLRALGFTVNVVDQRTNHEQAAKPVVRRKRK